MSLPDLPFASRYIYNLDKGLLDSLELLYFDSLTHELRSEQDYLEHKQANESSYTQQQLRVPVIQQVSVKPGAHSRDQSPRGTCAEDDFERYNKKRLAHNEKPLTEEEFEAKLDELSISGSEDDLEAESNGVDDALDPVIEGGDEEASSIGFLYTKSPMVLFGSKQVPANKCLGAYRTTLDAYTFESEPLKTLKSLNTAEMHSSLKDHVSALFMIGGGHFAGAIISHKPISTKGNKGTPEDLELQSVDLVASKTFHRYTTRRKQGGSQSASDSAIGKANSAGSSLRRYNEQALQQEVRELLKEWKPYLDKCDKIFVKANGVYSRNSLISKESTIQPDDKRIRMFPFTTKRPTTRELRRAWCELSHLHVTDLPSSNRSEVDKKRKQEEMLAKSRVRPQKKPQATVAKSEDAQHTSELVALLRRSKAPALVSYVRKNNIDPNMTLVPRSDYHFTPTMLHYSSKNGLQRMVQVLLTNLKADPTISNDSGKTASQLASNQETRYAFQVARSNLGEEYCDWDVMARVGPALTKEQVESLTKEAATEKDEQIKKINEEKLQDAKKNLKDQHTSKFGIGRALGVARTEQSNLNALTPEQRMKVMREQRARAAEARMKKSSS